MDKDFALHVCGKNSYFIDEKTHNRFGEDEINNYELSEICGIW